MQSDIDTASLATGPLGPALLEFRDRHPDAQALVEDFNRLLVSAVGDPFRREHQPGHFTGSALVLSVDGERTLLTHHRKLGLWLQPGGHADGERDLAAVALREAQEETGVADLVLDASAGILDLDRHWIPERAGEPGHWHYDVRYLVRAGDSERFQVTAESNALAWWSLIAVASDSRFESSLRRMAARVLENPTGA